jgi:hypothetical protein
MEHLAVYLKDGAYLAGDKIFETGNRYKIVHWRSIQKHVVIQLIVKKLNL